MGIFDKDLVLPGATTEIVLEGNKTYDTSLFGTTDSIAIIGTAFNGPVGVPIPIYAPEQAEYVFGGIFDPLTRQEATLVASVQDAWNAGARTIYAVRMSGISIHKDFQLAVDTTLKLRVSGIYPSNMNKEVCMLFSDEMNVMQIKIFKPAKSASLTERKQGLVENETDILVSTIELTNGQGLDKNSPLVDLINLVNTNASNNVLTLSIVDAEGNDVTLNSIEAKTLSIGEMFTGAYFIGRNKTKGSSNTDLSWELVDESNKPFEKFDRSLIKKLRFNTDINQDLPIVGIDFDFLNVPGKLDEVFEKDSIDYEEVDITNFEMYKKMGSGFAQTAKIVEKKPGVFRRIPTATDDVNRVMPLENGIYSMLENLNTNYRTIVAPADATIKGKLPKKEEFKIALGQSQSILNDNITVVAKIDKSDLSAIKQYKFEFEATQTDIDLETIKNSLYTEKVIKKIPGFIDLTDSDTKNSIKSMPDGTLFISNETLYRTEEGTAKKLNIATENPELIDKLFVVEDNLSSKLYKGEQSDTTITFKAIIDNTTVINKEYLLVENDGIVIVTRTSDITPIGSLSDIFDNEDEDELTLVSTQSLHGIVNTIRIKSNTLDYTTLEEFVDILNEHQDLKKYFTFTVAQDAFAKRYNDIYTEDEDSLIDNITKKAISSSFEDKKITYDTNLYIPYTTTDNFARQLAQHCTYTSLKTAPTHGIIGTSKLINVGLDTVDETVTKILNKDFDLYAKKNNGKSMLNAENLPYPLGKDLSIVVSQYTMSKNGYTFVSNGAAGYAGMVSVLPLDQSSTNQPIQIPTPSFELNKTQLQKLTKKGFVTFKQSYTKNWVVTDGTTMAPSDSIYRRLSASRISYSIEEVIRAAVEPFIGKQNHLANRNSMQTAIKSSLNKLVGKIIEAYDFSMIIDYSKEKLGIIEIDYNIIPIFEIREVRNRISISEDLK